MVFASNVTFHQCCVVGAIWKWEEGEERDGKDEGKGQTPKHHAIRKGHNTQFHTGHCWQMMIVSPQQKPLPLIVCLCCLFFFWFEPLPVRFHINSEHLLDTWQKLTIHTNVSLSFCLECFYKNDCAHLLHFLSLRGLFVHLKNISVGYVTYVEFKFVLCFVLFLEGGDSSPKPPRSFLYFTNFDTQI